MNLHTSFVRIVAATLIAAMPASALAATFFHKNEGELFISNPVQDDVYAAGTKVTVNETITGDVAAAGQVVTVESAVQQDLYAAGQAVRLLGSVGDDAHLAGNFVTVSGAISEDLFAAGQQVDVVGGAIVGQDAYLAGETITVSGTIHGTVRAAGSNVTIEPTAVIDGDLITYGATPTIRDGATITGSRQHHENVPGGEETRTVRGPIRGWVRSTLTLLVVMLVLTYLLPTATQGVLRRLQEKRMQSFVTGLIWMILVIPVSLILTATLIGLPLALIMVFGTVILYIVAAGMGALLVGSWAYKKLSPQASAQQTFGWPAAVVGAVIYTGVQLLGFAGWVVTFVLVLIALGATLQTLWHSRK